MVIEALLGYNVKGEIREPVKSAILKINQMDAIKIAVDIPAGIDPVTGEELGVSYKADYTITFFAMKPGMIRSIDKCGSVIIALQNLLHKTFES